jgi:hypothetical protein
MVRHGRTSMKKPDKANEAQNVRIAIATDGSNPYGMSTASYSYWPMIVIPLNLPPKVLMQRKTIFLSLSFLGSEYTGKNLNVFMQPLVDDLHHRTLTYDRAYEGIFYQELENFGDFQIQIGIEDLENDAQIHCEIMVNLKDIDMLNKFQAENGINDEPPSCDNDEPHYSHDTDSDNVKDHIEPHVWFW